MVDAPIVLTRWMVSWSKKIVSRSVGMAGTPSDLGGQRR